MNSLNFVLLFILILFVMLIFFKTGARARWAKNIRFFIVILGLAFFGYWFFQKSFSNFLEKSMSIQVINRVNQPLDIYAIKVIDKDQNKFLTTEIIGKSNIFISWYSRAILGSNTSNLLPTTNTGRESSGFPVLLYAITSDLGNYSCQQLLH